MILYYISQNLRFCKDSSQIQTIFLYMLKSEKKITYGVKCKEVRIEVGAIKATSSICVI